MAVSIKQEGIPTLHLDWELQHPAIDDGEEEMQTFPLEFKHAEDTPTNC